MPDKITTLKLVDNTDVFPNIKDENIPNTIMRIADLSKYLNQLKSINIIGDIDSTTITSDIATFTTADITTLNVSGVSQFEGEATFGHDVHVDGNVVVNGIDNIVDKAGNKIVRNESLDEFTKTFYDNCDVALYMNCELRTYTAIFYDSEHTVIIPFSDKVTNLESAFAGASTMELWDGQLSYITIPDITNPVASGSMFVWSHFTGIRFNNITLRFPIYAFAFCKELSYVNVVEDKKAKIYGTMFTTFAYSDKLAEVGSFDLTNVTAFHQAFTGCPSLKKLHCTHWRASFDISASVAFEQSDLVEIISNLDPVSTTQTLTMGSTNLAKLTQEQILVATGKGWTLA